MNATKPQLKVRILVVDDEQVILLLLKSALTDAGFEIAVASNARAALERMVSFNPSVAIVDNRLPGDMDGLVLCRRLREDYGVDVVVITGFESEYGYVDAVDSGASDFIVKPIKIEELILRCERVIETRRIRQMRDRSIRELSLFSPGIERRFMQRPLPSPRQCAWHELEYYCFIHFTVNTFTDKEWGYGDESPDLFNPTGFDADAVAKLVADAGMKGLILTCKHHDGFCLWPSKYTQHSVANSPWRDGQGDMVREFGDACRRHGVKFGVYLSPWDRNHPDYGTPAYITYFRNQLIELTTEYGELFEVWFDGANGGDGYYGGARQVRRIDRTTYYDWANTWRIVRENQPQAVMFSDAGPDVRWVGNEHGVAGDPCWSTIHSDLLYPGIDAAGFKTRLNDNMVDAWDSPTEYLNQGDRGGSVWLPAEVDVSIRPGWFYHASEDDRVRSPENLFDLYLKSVGRGTSLLVNLPPDRRGRIHETDCASVLGFRALRDAMYDSNCIGLADVVADSGEVADLLAQDGFIQSDKTTLEITCSFREPRTVGIVGLREHLPLGQRVDRWAIDTFENGCWEERQRGEAVGNRRLIEIGNRSVEKIRVRLAGCDAPAIRELGLYQNPVGD